MRESFFSDKDKIFRPGSSCRTDRDPITWATTDSPDWITWAPWRCLSSRAGRTPARTPGWVWTGTGSRSTERCHWRRTRRRWAGRRCAGGPRGTRCTPQADNHWWPHCWQTLPGSPRWPPAAWSPALPPSWGCRPPPLCGTASPGPGHASPAGPRTCSPPRRSTCCGGAPCPRCAPGRARPLPWPPPRRSSPRCGRTPPGWRRPPAGCCCSPGGPPAPGAPRCPRRARTRPRRTPGTRASAPSRCRCSSRPRIYFWTRPCAGAWIWASASGRSIRWMPCQPRRCESPGVLLRVLPANRRVSAACQHQVHRPWRKWPLSSPSIDDGGIGS